MDDEYGATEGERSGLFTAPDVVGWAPDGAVPYSDFASTSRAWFATRPFEPEGWWERAELEGPAQMSGNLRAYPTGQRDLEATGLEYYPSGSHLGGFPATPTVAMEDEVYA